MISILLSVLGLLVGSSGLAVAIWVLLGSNDENRPVAPAFDDSDLRTSLLDLGEVIEVLRADYATWKADINLAVAEGIQNVGRAEKRIQATIRRAKEQLEEHGMESAGLEAEYRDLQSVHGNGSDQIELPEVPPSVADCGDRFAAFPGTWDGSLNQD